MSLYGVIGYHVTLSEGHMIANHSEGHMIANHSIKGNTCAPSCGNFDLFVTNLFILYKRWYVTFKICVLWITKFSDKTIRLRVDPHSQYTHTHSPATILVLDIYERPKTLHKATIQ